jgi:hypothetical protein
LFSKGRIKVGAKTMDKFSADIMVLFLFSITLKHTIQVRQVLTGTY